MLQENLVFVIGIHPFIAFPFCFIINYLYLCTSQNIYEKIVFIFRGNPLCFNSL